MECWMNPYCAFEPCDWGMGLEEAQVPSTPLLHYSITPRRRIPERAGPDREFETPDKPNLTRLPDFPASRNRAPKQLKQDNDQDQCQTKNQSPPTT